MKTIKKICALLTALTLLFVMSATALASGYSIKYAADSQTSVPAAFGTSAADGRIWVDKSVTANPNGGFDVTLSALAQEYISNTASLKPGGSEEKPLAADVTFVLDMSTSMSSGNDVNDGTGKNITRLAAMVEATNDAIAIIMDANPENRVAIHWFGNSVGNVHVGTFLDMGSYRLSNGTAYLSVSGSTVKTTSYVQKLGTNGKYAAVSSVSVSTAAGTPMQNGIIYGIQKTIADINGKSAGSIGARQPYVFVLSDGAASIGNSEWWKTPSNPITPSSYKSVGKLTGNVSTGSKEVAASTILSAAYQRDLLVSAYKNYNGGTDYPITFYTVGLGPDTAINGASNYAWCGLNPTALNTLDSVTGNNPTSTAATTTKTQIASYVSSAGASYSKYASAANYTFSTYYQYADTYPKLDAAFTKLAVEVEAATQAVTMPTMTLENTSAGGSDCAMVFTDTLGDNMLLDGIKIGNVTGNLSGGVYTFGGLQSTASVSGNTITWNVAANDMKSHVYKIVDPKATTLTYTPPSSPLKLTYNIKLVGSITPDSQNYTYYSGSESSKGSAVYTPTRDNPYYCYTNKYVGNVAKLSDIGYPSIDSNITHYVKGTLIGSQSAGRVLSNVYVTSDMVEAAPVGTFSVSDVGRVITSLTMPSTGTYATAISASLYNCITATGDDTLLHTANFAFKNGVLKTTGSITEGKTTTNYGTDGKATAIFGNIGTMTLEMGVDLTAPSNVVAGSEVIYEITLYNYTNQEISNVSVALLSDMPATFGPLGFKSLSLVGVGTLDDITVPANGTTVVESTATAPSTSGVAYTSQAVVTKIGGIATTAGNQPISDTMRVTVLEAGFGATIDTTKDGQTWTNPNTITLVDGSTTINDLNDVPPGSYEVYEKGNSTGVTIEVDGLSPTVTLEYFTLRLVAGDGIDSVVGEGIYLAGMEVPITAILSSGQEQGDGTYVGGTWNGSEWVDGKWIDGEWTGYQWGGWSADGFTAPYDHDAKITMPSRSLTLTANASNLGTGKDVQGKVVEGNDRKVYKIDIAWGAMAFDYSLGNRWNPDTHAYDGDQINAWLPDSFFTEGNNLITTYNHSNADVLVSFDVSGNILDGVEMVVNKTNSDLGAVAVNVPLSRVPYETADAPSIPAYLWLTGSPTQETLNTMGSYIKVAVITVTIEAVTGSELTPKDTP